MTAIRNNLTRVGTRTVPVPKEGDRNAKRRVRRKIQHPRGICSVCGGDYIVKADRKIGVHKGFGTGARCPGTDRYPRANSDAGTDFTPALVHSFVRRYSDMHGKRPTVLQVTDELRARHGDARVREVAKQFGLVAVGRNGDRI